MTSTTQQIEPRHAPVVFEEFFELGQEETVSPFLTPNSRRWGANLSLKSALLAALFLILAFAFSFHPFLVPLSNILLIFVFFLAGVPSLIESIEDLANWDVNIDVLMTLAAFSSVLIGSSMEGALLLVLFALSHSMEDAVTSRAKGAISSLKKISPTRAHVINEEGGLVQRAVEDIDLKTHILVKSGEIVPLDGKVIEGESSVNLVHLTGENLPAPKKVGDQVPAGARNLEGAIVLEVTRTSADSTLARIIQLVTEAQEARPKLQRWFDSVSRRYAISIICLSGIFALTFPFILGIPLLGLEGSIYRALAFLIAASPCALIIAIPIAYLSAVSACARTGILIKGGITLDALAGCKAVAFDKTGTLTTGELHLLQIEGFDCTDPEALKEAAAIAYALEKNAVHPIAKAVIKHAEENQIRPVKLSAFRAISGHGLQAEYAGKQVAIGRPSFITPKLSEERAELVQKAADLAQEEGELVAVLIVGDRPFLFRLQDTLRPDMAKTVQSLQQKQKLRLVMLTGDHVENAKTIAAETGIKHYYANLKPEDKMHHVAQLAKDYGLAMVGDGINDAPALARASVGICMGKVGQTAAMEAADIVLLQDNIEQLEWLFRKAKKTQAIVRENLALAAGAILIATIPALAGLVPLWLAVVLHEGGTVLVGLNGLRLLKR